jgi:streptomycin 6-kinase
MPNGSGDLFAKAKSMLARLLSDAPAPALLHGDLHHDNIAKSSRSWLAYDPKGVWGDPHYEFANAFQNPLGMNKQITNPDRAHNLARIFAERCGLDKVRLLQWAGVHSALSACWSLQGPDFPSEHLPIMRTMLSICD